MERREIFLRDDIADEPRLLFIFWHAWQSTPATQDDKQRADLVRVALANKLVLTKEQVLSLKSHYSEVFEAAAFDEELITGAGTTDSSVLVPPDTCPCAKVHLGRRDGGHVVTMDKRLRETELRLFGMQGVQYVGCATASCSCGAVLYLSEWRAARDAPRQYYADAHKRPYFVATRQVCPLR